MIVETIIAGAVIIGAYFIAKYWDQLVDWFKYKFLPEVQRLVGKVKHDTLCYLNRVGDNLVNFISKVFRPKMFGKIEVTTTTTEISRDQLPARLRNKAYYNMENDVTDDVENEMCLTLSNY